MHQMIFNKESPRVSEEASEDISSVARWFVEENFTYVRVFRSYSSPRVLSYYVPDKFLAWEIAYQLVNGITKQLKNANKAIWPNFPVQCGTFALYDIGHSYKEVSKINLLKLAEMPKRLYDPNDVIKNYTTELKIKPFVKEKLGQMTFLASFSCLEIPLTSW